MENNDKLKTSVLTWFDKIEAMAISTLARVCVAPADAVGMHVSVGEYGVGICGNLPKILKDCLNQPFIDGIQEVKIGNLDSPLMKAFVAVEILAYCQYSKYGSNPAIGTSENILRQVSEDWLRSPSPWVMVKLANAISSAVNIMNDPERLAEHTLNICRMNGRKANNIPSKWSSNLNTIIKDILDNRPKKPRINRIDEYVFSSLIGRADGDITEITSDSENNGKLVIWHRDGGKKSNDIQGSPLFAVLSPSTKPEDRKELLALGAIKKRISKINSQKT